MLAQRTPPVQSRRRRDDYGGRSCGHELQRAHSPDRGELDGLRFVGAEGRELHYDQDEIPRPLQED